MKFPEENNEKKTIKSKGRLQNLRLTAFLFWKDMSILQNIFLHWGGIFIIERVVNVLSSGPPCKDGKSWFMAVPLKLWLIKYGLDINV